MQNCEGKYYVFNWKSIKQKKCDVRQCTIKYFTYEQKNF